jgi:hypothetical protein
MAKTKKGALLLVALVAIAAAWAICPARPLCPNHSGVQLDLDGLAYAKGGHNYQDYRCPVGGEKYTYRCD